jgi:two-component system response regulator AtoC
VIVSRAVSTARSVVGGSHVAITDPTLTEPSALLVAVARSPVSIVIGGETGVGKEVLAQALHRLSNRPGPILAINCAAIAPTLLESELFGHVRGAFTGAVSDKPGLLEAAAGGTVLFDEIGELPLDLQAKLLRAIETREVVRVGAVRPAAVNVRFLAATHKDLVAASQVGEFRRDLFYRLAGITLTIAPLRDRPHQIAALASRFAREIGDVSVGAAALSRLGVHDWPGNVRELRNVIERAALLAAGEEIGAEHILLDTTASRPAVSTSDELTGEQFAERDRIISALETSAGNQSQAAKQLGISRANLVNKLALYRIPRPRDKKK